MMVISAFTAQKILDAAYSNKTKADITIEVSLDLGLTKGTAKYAASGIILTHETSKAVESEIITQDDLKKIIKNDKVCFLVKNNSIHKIQLFSAETNTFLKLMPTGENTAPTIELSGIRMHNIKNQDAITDAKNKVAAVNVHGKVLDTCFGQGYTAIAAAGKKEVTEVYTHERDANIVEIAKHNPWSAEVFINKKIKLKITDTNKEIKNYKDDEFDAIIHDPPMHKLSPAMYAPEFYSELFLVLKKGGEI